MKSITTELKGTFGTGQAQVLEDMVRKIEPYEPLAKRDYECATFIREGNIIKGIRINYFINSHYIGSGLYDLKGGKAGLIPNERWRAILPKFFEKMGWKEGLEPGPEETYPLAKDYAA